MTVQYYEKRFALASILIQKRRDFSLNAKLPTNGSIFRVEPGSVGCGFVFFNQYNHKWYIVESEVGYKLDKSDVYANLTYARFFYCVEDNGAELISWVNLCCEDPSAYFQVMERGKTVWMQRRDDTEGRVFFVERPDIRVEPVFSGELERVFNDDFMSRYIDSSDHPVLKVKNLKEWRQRKKNPCHP